MYLIQLGGEIDIVPISHNILEIVWIEAQDTMLKCE